MVPPDWRTSSTLSAIGTLLDAVARVAMAYTLPPDLVPGLNLAMYVATAVVLNVVTTVVYVRAGALGRRRRTPAVGWAHPSRKVRSICHHILGRGAPHGRGPGTAAGGDGESEGGPPAGHRGARGHAGGRDRAEGVVLRRLRRARGVAAAPRPGRLDDGRASSTRTPVVAASASSSAAWRSASSGCCCRLVDDRGAGETRVVQFFGRYIGTVRRTGLTWVVPLSTRRRVSVRVRNFETNALKVNDADGNPVEIAAIVVWQVADTAKATFAVENYDHFVAVQSEAALRHVATTHPYDDTDPARHPARLHRRGLRRTRPRGRGADRRRRASRSSRCGSATWPTPRRSPRPCCNANRPAP